MTRTKLLSGWYKFTLGRGSAGCRQCGRLGWEVYFRDENGKPVAPTIVPGETILQPNYKAAVSFIETMEKRLPWFQATSLTGSSSRSIV